MARVKCDLCPATFKTPQAKGAHYRYEHPDHIKRKAKSPRRKPQIDLAVDVMLGHLFPKGIPPEKYEDVISWIEATRRLAT